MHTLESRPQNALSRSRYSRRGEIGAGCIGCLIVTGILLVLLIAGGIFVKMKWKGWAVGGFRQAVTQGLNESNLPDDQVTALLVEYDRVGEKFKKGEIGVTELTKLAEELVDSPAVPFAAVKVVEAAYLSRSTLEQEQKDEVIRSMQRYARGISDQRIDKDTMKRTLDPIAAWTGKNNLQVREPSVVTDEDLLRLGTMAKEQADEAGVEDEPFEVDLASEVRRVIDEILGQTSAVEQKPEEEPEGG